MRLDSIYTSDKDCHGSQEVSDMVEIVEATTDEHYRQARLLIEEYAHFLGFDLEFQGFSRELASLAKIYSPPKGAMLMVRSDTAFVGCVGLRDLSEGFAEMKRMYIQPAFQGKGFGRLLLEAFISKARELRYKAIRLDTVPALDRALVLYRQYGFSEIASYRYNPAPDAIFMELKL